MKDCTKMISRANRFTKHELQMPIVEVLLPRVFYRKYLVFFLVGREKITILRVTRKSSQIGGAAGLVIAHDQKRNSHRWPSPSQFGDSGHLRKGL